MKKASLAAYVLAVVISGTIALVFAMGWAPLDGWQELLTYYTDEESVRSKLGYRVSLTRHS